MRPHRASSTTSSRTPIPGFTLGYLAHALLFVNNFYWAANAAQRKRYLPKVLSGEHVGAMGMTEPAVGTDVLGLQTTARATATSTSSTVARRSSRTVPSATSPSSTRSSSDRITTFVVERGFAGLHDEPEDPEGRHARVDDERADLRRLPRARREPGRHRGRRHHEHDAQPRDRAARPLGDEPRHRAALPRRDGAVRDRAPHVRQAARTSTARSSATSATASRRSRRCAR